MPDQTSRRISRGGPFFDCLTATASGLLVFGILLAFGSALVFAGFAAATTPEVLATLGGAAESQMAGLVFFIILAWWVVAWGGIVVGLIMAGAGFGLLRFATRSVLPPQASASGSGE